MRKSSSKLTKQIEIQDRSKNDRIKNVLMPGYLDRIGAGKVLVNREPFSFDWTPDNLVGRDRELTELASMFTHVVNQNSSCSRIRLRLRLPSVCWSRSGDHACALEFPPIRHNSGVGTLSCRYTPVRCADVPVQI